MRTTIVIPQALYGKIVEAAEREDRSISSLLRRAAVQYIEVETNDLQR